jgi:hypothetical protein
MIQRGGTQIRGDAPDGCDPDLDKADERLRRSTTIVQVLFVDRAGGRARA